MKPKLLTRNVFKTAISTYDKATWTGTNCSGWEPLGDHVLIYPDQAQSLYGSGENKIEIPADIVARQNLAAEAGVVVATGPDVTIPIKPGDRVFNERYAGQLVTGHDEKVYRLMSQSSIGAVHKENKNG